MPLVKIHELKALSAFYQDVIKNGKRFEVRKDDRDPAFQIGHYLLLREYARIIDGEAIYTGQETIVGPITYILRDFELGVRPGYCVIGW